MAGELQFSNTVLSALWVLFRTTPARQPCQRQRAVHLHDRATPAPRTAAGHVQPEPYRKNRNRE